MTRKRLISLFLTILLGATAVFSAQKGWENVKADISDARSVVKDESIEILTGPNVIIVSSTQKVDIQVFTILGRLVSAASLEPGLYRLSVSANGVYIVKAGTLTCKVAI